MGVVKNLVGHVFGRLSVQRFAGIVNHKAVWDCQCECGVFKQVSSRSLLSGKTLSCGCLKTELQTKHGMSDTRQYEVWVNMWQRCSNPLNKNFNEYMGRGISITEKWKTFEGFWEDMSEGYSDELTLDRIDVDGNYCKENCRWVSQTVQLHNKRKRNGCSSDYIGVIKRGDRYTAQIVLKGDSTFIGSYKNELDAAIAYDDASEKMYGDRPNKTIKKGSSM